jgi:hypothetical protein
MKAIKIIVLVLLIAVPSSAFGWSGRAGAFRPGFNRGIVASRFVGGVPPRFFFNRNRFFFPNRFFFSQAFFPGPYSYYPYSYYPSSYGYSPYVYQPYSYPTSYDIAPPPPAGAAEDAYNRGYSEGYTQGYEQGQKEREKELYEEGKKRGYEEGHNAGKDSQNP